MFDGAQVASTIKVPLLPSAPAFLSESSSSLESVSFDSLSLASCMIISLISPSISGVRRLRKYTIKDGQKAVFHHCSPDIHKSTEDTDFPGFEGLFPHLNSHTLPV